jgi:hypothetical protein
LTELAAEQRRPPEVSAVQRLEAVNEEPQWIVQLPAADFERKARNVRKFRRAARAVDALHASDQRRERARDALDGPDPV